MEYYTVSEYAELMHKDPGNIRRLLKYGRLIGEKMGKQWVIPKGTEYPADRRVKSGEYVNQRQKNRLTKDKPDLMKSLRSLAKTLGEIYGEEAVQVSLYGSYARGDETGESDVDLAFIIKGESEENHEKMTDIVIDYELDLAVTLSVIQINLDEYNKWHETVPFYRNIEKEGIVLWKAA